MPKYLKADWNGCSVSLRPTGVRRIFRFWPFFVGDRIRLNLTIKRTEGTFIPDTLVCNEVIPSAEETYRENTIAAIAIEGMAKGRHITKLVRGGVITSSYEGFYTAHGDRDSKRRIVMTFQSHPSEKLVFLWIGLLGTLFGAIIGSITTWLLTNA